MKKIPLSKGQFALVDDEDFPYLNRFKWRAVANKSGSYDVSTSISIGSRVHAIPMWCFLLENQSRRKIIFLNRNPLDHRKVNLYLGTPSEFNISQPKSPVGNGSGRVTSKYKGVSYRANRKPKYRWEAVIQKDRNPIRRSFATEKEAALWWNEKALELYGAIAYLNEVD